MMKFLKYATLILLIFLIACSSDDKDKPDPPRDETEVYQENLQEIEEYLATHFYYLEENTGIHNYKRVLFDTVGGENADKTPLIEDEALKSKIVKTRKLEYKVYYLSIREGFEEVYQPTFGDKVAITYRAIDMDGSLFAETVNAEAIDIPRTNHPLFNMGRIRGTIAGITEFKGASGFEENPDGTLTYEDDYGIGAVFIPSGLAYFQNPPISFSLRSYQPFVFSFQLYGAVQMDHDNDGIPSYMEDLEGYEFLHETDTDKDGVPNFLDSDDDGDGVPTRDEIIIHETDKDWLTPEDIEFPDSNNSGIPDYLDPTI
ncbi:MAG TPA: hypothetical protein VK021_13110 [Flavobacteriaceae bacterium]|nr:hypothetical protein [Flavobacteriaceae bacterium]